MKNVAKKMFAVSVTTMLVAALSACGGFKGEGKWKCSDIGAVTIKHESGNNYSVDFDGFTMIGTLKDGMLDLPEGKGKAFVNNEGKLKFSMFTCARAS